MTEQQQHDMRLRYFAQHCLAHAGEFCPRTVERDGKKDRITWAELFHLRVGVTPNSYLSTSFGGAVVKIETLHHALNTFFAGTDSPLPSASVALSDLSRVAERCSGNRESFS